MRRYRSKAWLADLGRFASLDVYRALAILAVVGIHVSGHSLPLLDAERDWRAAAVINRALQFAVPAFLTLSAFLNLRPLMRREGLGEYFRKRALRALWPYLLWSVLYAVFRTRIGPDELTWDRMGAWLLTGKAYYHLYFLLVALQLYLLLPLVAWWFRKRPTFGETAIVALGLQWLVFFLNRRYALFTAPGSVLLWYLPSVGLGCWLATRADRLEAVSGRSARLALVVTLAAAAVYLPQGLAMLRDEPVRAAALQGGLWIYAPGVALLMLTASGWLVQTPLARGLNVIGARSMEIYLAHPLVIWALDETVPASLLPPKPAIPVYFLACLAVPMGFAALVERLGLSRFVWGVGPSGRK